MIRFYGRCFDIETKRKGKKMNKGVLSTKVGIIGGGQLGKMMINEAAKMGIKTVILDPSNDCPAGPLANDQIVAGFDDKLALLDLANKVDVLTCEFEHISTDALAYLEEKGHLVYPSSSILKIIQHKYHQKLELQKHHIPLGDFMAIEGVEGIKEAASIYGYPIMLKSALDGYDGKGNSLILSEEEIKTSYDRLKGDTNPLYVEKFIPFVKEISVLCCYGKNGEIVTYPVAENVHKNSILFETCVPADITKEIENQALSVAKSVCEVFHSVGILCIEMFVTNSGEILVNEVAPRPHNSGHYSIEGCVTSQFENHIRAVIGLPLGSTKLLCPTVMRNILGEEGYDGEAMVEGVSEALALEGVSLHIYGKAETKPNRKMGHLTVTNESLEKAKKIAQKGSEELRVKSEEI